MNSPAGPTFTPVRVYLRTVPQYPVTGFKGADGVVRLGNRSGYPYDCSPAIRSEEILFVDDIGEPIRHPE